MTVNVRMMLRNIAMEFVKRSAFGWGNSTARAANPTQGLVIHYDGPGSLLTKKTHEHCVSYWKSVRDFHMKSNAWADIGYSFGVCPHTSPRNGGYVLEGRGTHREQAAQPGGNRTFYSVSLMLGDGELPTDVQIDTVRELREYLELQTGMRNQIKGHRDFISTKCPGDTLYAMVKNGTFSEPSGESEVSAEKVWDYPIDTGDGKAPWRAKTVLGHLEKQQDDMWAAIREILAILKE